MWDKITETESESRQYNLRKLLSYFDNKNHRINVIYLKKLQYDIDYVWQYRAIVLFTNSVASFLAIFQQINEIPYEAFKRNLSQEIDSTMLNTIDIMPTCGNTLYNT